jgi:hypothetical protein
MEPRHINIPLEERRHVLRHCSALFHVEPGSKPDRVSHAQGGITMHNMRSIGWNRISGRDEDHLVIEVKNVLKFLDSLETMEGKKPSVTTIFEDGSFLILSSGNDVWCTHSFMEGANNDTIAHRVGVTAKYGESVLSS